MHTDMTILKSFLFSQNKKTKLEQFISYKYDYYI
jgi:hypothetical protein